MPDTLPMKVLTVVSVAIVVVDFEVLRSTFKEYFQLKQVLENDPYQQCYKPQAQLRIVFQCYAIYAALVCTTLTSMLAFNCSDMFVEAVARLIINLCFMVFGPILLTFVNYGFVHFKQLSFICTPRGASHHINFVDIVLLLGCFVLALCVTFTMAMQKTLDMAQQSFQDEGSLVYRLTSMYFSYQLRQSQERDRQLLRRNVEQRREQRRLYQAQRAQVLTAFQREHPEIATVGSSGGALEQNGECLGRTPAGGAPSSQLVATTVSGAGALSGTNGTQRVLANDNGPRINRDLGNIQSSLGSGALHTLHNNNDDNEPYILEEDFDEEMNNLHGGIQQRVTNYEYAQMQEDKQLNNFRNDMPEAQIINSFRTLNQQIIASEAAKKQREAAQFANRQVNSGSFRIQDNIADSVRNANLGEDLYMASDVQANIQATNEHNEEQETGEQLIKDAKTSSGVSSQASTNLQTQIGGSQVSSAAAAVSSSGLNTQQHLSVPAAGAVPPSNNGAALSVLNEENHSDQAFQSLDGAAASKDEQDFDKQSSYSNFSSKKNGKQKKEKKD